MSLKPIAFTAAIIVGVVSAAAAVWLLSHNYPKAIDTSTSSMILDGDRIDFPIGAFAAERFDDDSVGIAFKDHAGNDFKFAVDDSEPRNVYRCTDKCDWHTGRVISDKNSAIRLIYSLLRSHPAGSVVAPEELDSVCDILFPRNYLVLKRTFFRR